MSAETSLGHQVLLIPFESVLLAQSFPGVVAAVAVNRVASNDGAGGADIIVVIFTIAVMVQIGRSEPLDGSFPETKPTAFHGRTGRKGLCGRWGQRPHGGIMRR